MICGAIGERAYVILVWVKAPNIENASHPQRLGIMMKNHKLCVVYNIQILECSK
jgi:hypothetical protein